jgi:flagellar hook-associated protein 1 FlgK
MLGLFGTLNVATRALSTQRQGTEVAGHNLANVNNPAYARQRIEVSTSLPIPGGLGPQGTGVEATGIRQLRSDVLDRQVIVETSVQGSLEAQQRALEYAQANLGQTLDRQATGAAGAAAAGGVGGQNGLAENLNAFFNSLQGLSTQPTSMSERQALVIKAQDLTTQFQQVSRRLGDVDTLLNQSLASDVETANGLLGDIAKINEQILSVEGTGAVANDLRDIRLQRFEDLAKLGQVTLIEAPGGSVDVAMGGVRLTQADRVIEQLEVFDPGDGRLQVRAVGGGGALDMGGGSIQGTLEARDGALATLRQSLDQLAGSLMGEFNALYSAGYDLRGGTGGLFFEGTDASNIRLAAGLVEDPALIQASGDPAAVGNNEVVLSLARLAEKPLVALGGQTLGQHYGQTVARLGQSLASVNTQLDNQTVVGELLARQRDAVSGVSLDEEMTDLIRYQRAFEASARMVRLVDDMLETVMNMKR